VLRRRASVRPWFVRRLETVDLRRRERAYSSAISSWSRPHLRKYRAIVRKPSRVASYIEGEWNWRCRFGSYRRAMAIDPVASAACFSTAWSAPRPRGRRFFVEREAAGAMIGEVRESAPTGDLRVEAIELGSRKRGLSPDLGISAISARQDDGCLATNDARSCR